jgi:hypothetical protein
MANRKVGIYTLGTKQIAKPNPKDPYKIVSTKTQIIGFGPNDYSKEIVGGKKKKGR